MSLEAFLNKFNSPDGKYAYTLYPLKTFKAYIKFNTGNVSGSENQTMLQRGISNLLNNATGGLFGKAINSAKGDISQNGIENIGKIANDSLITESYNGALDITYFTQSGTLPTISIPDDSPVETVIGSLKTHKMAVETDSKEFSLQILNTKVSLIDRIFYPWMREISYPYWSYDEYPYTTATITIDFTDHNDIKYVFLGSRPTKIETLNPTNALDTNMARQVTFAFDFMYISSLGKNSESIKDTIKNSATSIVNKAASMIGL